MKKFNSIMLVDDDETCNFITEKIISKLNVSSYTHSMKNGREALNFMESHYPEPSTTIPGLFPDLIFLDINMPVMDGVEFLEELQSNKKLERKYTNDIKIYVLSSSDDPYDREKMSKYNIMGYISKPMTVDKIMEITGR